MLGMDSAKVAFDPFQPLATQETKGDVTVVADDVIVAPVLANERAAASILRIGNVKVVKNYTSCAVV